MRRRVAGLIVLALLAIGVGVGEALTPPTQHVLLIGDSIMRQTGPSLANQLGDDYTVHNEAVNGSGLLTPDFFNWPDHLEQVLAQTDPDVVVFLMIGNYTAEPEEFWRTPEGRVVRDIGSPAFAREWGRQADLAMDQLAETGAPVILVLPPPMVTDELQAVEDGLRAEYERIARERPFVHLVDAEDAIGGPNGEWVGELPAGDGSVRPVRTADTVHLAPHGARLMARELLPAVEAQAG